MVSTGDEGNDALIYGIPLEAGGGGWTPADLGSDVLRGWWKADEGVHSDVDGVYQWDDMSGNGFHMLQATGSKKPDISDAKFGGLNSVKFDDIDDTVKTGAVYDSAELQPAPDDHIYLFFVVDHDTPAGYDVFGDMGNANAHGGFKANTHTGGSYKNYFFRQAAGGYYDPDWVQSGAHTIVVLLRHTTGWYTVSDGTQNAGVFGNSAFTSYVNYPRLYSLSGSAYNTSYPYGGYTREAGVIQQAAALSEGDLASLQAYLLERAGL